MAFWLEVGCHVALFASTFLCLRLMFCHVYVLSSYKTSLLMRNASLTISERVMFCKMIFSVSFTGLLGKRNSECYPHVPAFDLSISTSDTPPQKCNQRSGPPLLLVSNTKPMFWPLNRFSEVKKKKS